jgi:hypothetical protein
MYRITFAAASSLLLPALRCCHNGVDQTAAMVADARADVGQAKRRVDEAAKDVDGARAAAALQPGDTNLAAAVEKREAELLDRQAWLRVCKAELEKARGAAAVQRPFELPSRVVALEQLGALARSQRFEVPTQALKGVERYVRVLRDVFGTYLLARRSYPNLAVVATPGAGKTTLLRYLQQTADTVRYGADLQADTNWLAKSWSAPRPPVNERSVGDPEPSVPKLRHVFVGYATFKQGSDTSFDPFADTNIYGMITRRCAWRILHDAGLASEWTPDLGLNLDQTAKALRAKIAAAKGCGPDEVAIVFLIDDVTDIPKGPRRVLLDSMTAWQQWDHSRGRLSFSLSPGIRFSR